MSDFLSQAHMGFYPLKPSTHGLLSAPKLGDLNHALTCRQSGAFSRLY
ncbi:hypothetical protein AO372_0506 [Moraxella catarrhalis]|nr:hypothetical protein AO372_0506 [Moraxella catarrhalis]